MFIPGIATPSICIKKETLGNVEGSNALSLWWWTCNTIRNKTLVAHVRNTNH